MTLNKIYKKFGDWKPTCNLRFCGAVLQQEWTRDIFLQPEKMHPSVRVILPSDVEKEWRRVPGVEPTVSDRPVVL